MRSITDVMSAGSSVSKGSIRNRLFLAGYLAGITVATISWVSAVGWAAVRTLEWLLT